MKRLVLIGLSILLILVVVSPVLAYRVGPVPGGYLLVLDDFEVVQKSAWGNVSPTDVFLWLHTSGAKSVSLRFTLPRAYGGRYYVSEASLYLTSALVSYPADVTVTSAVGDYLPTARVGSVKQEVRLDVINTYNWETDQFVVDLRAIPVNGVSAGVAFWSRYASPSGIRPRLEVKLTEERPGGVVWRQVPNATNIPLAEIERCHQNYQTGAIGTEAAFCEYSPEQGWHWRLDNFWSCARGSISCPQPGSDCWYTETEAGTAGNVSPCSSLPSPFESPEECPTLESCCRIQHFDSTFDAQCKEGARLAGDPDWEQWLGFRYCYCKGSDCSQKDDGYMCTRSKGGLSVQTGTCPCGCI